MPPHPGLMRNRVLMLENRLKSLEPGANAQDFDLSKVVVKPEDTAGAPMGWKG